MRRSWIRRALPRSLFARVLLILLLPIVLAQLVATYIFLNRHWENLTNRLASSVAGEVALAVALADDQAERGDPPAAIRQTLLHMTRSTDLRFTLVAGAGGQDPLPPAAGSRPSGMISVALWRALRLRLDTRPFTVSDRGEARWHDVSVETRAGMLHIAVPQRRLYSATALVFLMWMTGSALLFFGIATLFLRNQIRPILRLARAAEAFGKGQDVAGFKPEGALEVRRAAEAFLVMRERIRRQIRQRTEMLAGVSHDLRTPLTRMKLQLALMKGEDSARQELQSDVADMEQMVDGYLSFARGEGEEGALPADLLTLLEESIANAQRETGRQVAFTAARDSCLVTIRPQAMRRAISNLVNNALRYGQTVRVALEEEDKAFFIRVEDDGPGIPPERRADVLRPFVRLEDSRNPDTGGVGLGLTIASDVAKSHGGDLTLDASPSLRGLRATIRLPR